MSFIAIINRVGWVPLALLSVMLLAARTAADDTLPRVKAALPKLDQFAAQIMKKTGVPGMAIAVVCNGEVVHVKGLGVRQVGAEERVDADTVFQLASVSKPLASTILAALVSEGVIAWDDRVIDHDPAFRLSAPWVTRAVTLRDLLCHRSGLPSHAGDLLEDLGYARAEVIRRLRFERLGSNFRSQYAYTNFGYSAAAFAAARASGKTWEDLASEKLFRPLAMKSSSYRFADFAAAKNRAKLHVRMDGKWVARYVREPDAQAPAGGGSSSVRDLARWMLLQLGGGKLGRQVIATKALGETHRPQIISSQPRNPMKDRAEFYGLGWNVSYDDEGRVRLGHSGAFTSGAATVVALLPAKGIGIVVLTNTAPIGVPEAVSATFFDLVAKGKIEKDWFAAFQPVFAALIKPDYGTEVDYSKPPAKRAAPLPLEAYAGSYRNDYFGDLDIGVEDKRWFFGWGRRGERRR